MSAVLDTASVHLGHWVNWSLGSVRGSTITMSRRDGALLTAFLAMFVTFAGTRIWKLAAFGIYLSLSRNSPQDALFNQRQAILRNSSTAEVALYSLLKVVWAWRATKPSPRVYRRAGPLALASLVASLGFAVAGVFSSRISSTMGNEVLLSGHGCAWLNDSSFDAEAIVSIEQPYNSEVNQDASQRALQCYNSNVSTNCQTFVRPSISVLVTQNASCPFSPKICQSNTANLLVDSGYVDSHFDLGINAPLEKRITSRYVMQCAPLVVDNYSSIMEHPTSQDGTILQSVDQQWTQYLYGKITSHLPINFTYQYPMDVPRNTSVMPGATVFNSDYTIATSIAHANNSFSESANFIAIPELSLTDADTVLIFLSANSVLYSEPIDDPWYSVHQGPFNINVGGGPGGPTTLPVWFADNPANVLGCTQQIQFCNPNLPLKQGCGPLTSPMVLVNQILGSDVPPVVFPWRDQTEATRFAKFLRTWNQYSSDPSTIIPGLGSATLSSRRNFHQGFQGLLPSNQWQLDVQYWFSMELATIQRAFVEAANGPKYPGLDGDLLAGPQDSLDREFCSNQKILSTDFTSFSTLGLVLTFVIGGILIMISFFLEPILYLIQRRWQWENYAVSDWWLNETLQLQSFVNDGLGAGTWTRKMGLPPTTLPGERLATLDLSNAREPRFRAPQPASESLAGESSDGKLGVETIEVSGGEKPGTVQTIEKVGSSTLTSSIAADDTNPDAPANDQHAALDISGHDSENYGGEHHESKNHDSHSSG